MNLLLQHRGGFGLSAFRLLSAPRRAVGLVLGWCVSLVLTLALGHHASRSGLAVESGGSTTRSMELGSSVGSMSAVVPPSDYCNLAMIEIVSSVVLYYCSGDCTEIPPGGIWPTCRWWIYDAATPPEATCFCVHDDRIYISPKKCLGQLVNPTEGEPYKMADAFYCSKAACTEDCVKQNAGPFGAMACECQ